MKPEKLLTKYQNFQKENHRTRKHMPSSEVELNNKSGQLPPSLCISCFIHFNCTLNLIFHIWSMKVSSIRNKIAMFLHHLGIKFLI